MSVIEQKQERAIRQFESLKPELLKLFLGSPEYGYSSLVVHFYEGEITRLIFGYEESVIPCEVNLPVSVKRKKYVLKHSKA